MDKEKLEKVKRLLADKAKNIVITIHVNPDGDAIGASLGFYIFLKLSNYQNVSLISPNDYPEFLKWIPGNKNIIIAENNLPKAEKIISQADLIFCLDYNDIERTDNLKSPLEKSTAKKVLIDHHPQPSEEFDISFSLTNTSSTAEIVYKLIQNINPDVLNKDIAATLFAGIMTDTGSFSYGCNNPDTFSVCAELVKTGINADNIHRLVYDTYSENRMKLLGYCLYEKLTLLPQLYTAYFHLTMNELEKFNHKDGDTEGIVNYALSINNIDLAALFIEKEDHIKVSLRSIGNINVNDFARQYFNGGGHANAAGGKIYKEINNAIEYFESVLKDFRKGKTNNAKNIKP